MAGVRELSVCSRSRAEKRQVSHGGKYPKTKATKADFGRVISFGRNSCYTRYDIPVTVARAVWVNRPLERRNDVDIMLQHGFEYYKSNKQVFKKIP